MTIRRPEPAGLDPSAELAELFHRTMRRIHHGSREALAPFGVSGSQARLIRLLADGPLRMAQIADHLAVAPRTVTDIVDGAELSNLVARRPDPFDRRSTLVELTLQGRMLLEHLVEARRASAARVFGSLSERQQAELVAVLRSICDESATPDGACAEPDPGHRSEGLQLEDDAPAAAVASRGGGAA